MRVFFATIVLVPFLGCSPIIFDQRSNGLALDRDVDDIFTIALPRCAEDLQKVRLMPEVLGRAVRLLEQSDPRGTSETCFKFLASEAGEAEIKVWRVGPDGHRLAEEYSLKVRVRLCDW